MYLKHDVHLSEYQVKRIIKGIKDDETIRIRLGDGAIPTHLMLTQADINHLSKSNMVNLSRSHLQNNKHLLDLFPNTSPQKVTQRRGVAINPNPVVLDAGEEIEELIQQYKQNLTVDELNDLITTITNLLILKNPPQEGEGIFSLALPFIKTVLPKVLGTLGLAAATGAVSGATNKATSGRSIRFTNGDAKIVKDLYNKMYDGEMEGGFIGTLLAGLAGSLLPALLGGKGLYRAGTKLKKKF